MGRVWRGSPHDRSIHPSINLNQCSVETHQTGRADAGHHCHPAAGHGHHHRHQGQRAPGRAAPPRAHAHRAVPHGALPDPRKVLRGAAGAVPERGPRRLAQPHPPVLRPGQRRRGACVRVARRRCAARPISVSDFIKSKTHSLPIVTTCQHTHTHRPSPSPRSSPTRSPPPTWSTT